MENRILDQLKETENRYRLLTELSPDCIKIFDLDGNTLFINTGGKEEHNLKNETDVRNFKAIDTVIDEDKYKFLHAFENAKKGIGSVIEMRHTKEGSNREICSEMVHPIQDANGNVVAILGVSRDMTEFWNAVKMSEKATGELEKMNKSMVGRELKMSLQKKEIKNLKEYISKLENQAGMIK
jgi:PAS domain S-box-containing protein